MSTDVGQRPEVWVNIEGIKPKVVSTVVNDGVLTINLVEILFPKAEEYLHNNVKMFTSDGTRIRLYEKISDLLASGHGNKDAPLKIWIPRNMSTDVGQRLEVLVNIEGIKPKVVSTVVNDGVLTLNLVRNLFPKAKGSFHTNVLVSKSDGAEIDFLEKISDLLVSGHGNKDAPLKIWIPSILQLGLPPLTRHSASSAPAGSTHPSATVVISKFKTLEQDKEPKITRESKLWYSLKSDRKESLHWSSEAGIVEFVKLVLNDIAREAGIDCLTCMTELSLFDNKRADIWLVCAYGVPVGVIEVKNPRKSDRHQSPLSNQNVLGQLFDYVSHLRTYAGRHHAFGILTTYNEWRIVWLPDTQDVAELTTITPCEQRNKSIAVLPTDPPNWDESTTDELTENSPASATQHSDVERKLHVSDIYTFDHPDLPHVLLSVMRKMLSSPVTSRSVSTLEPQQSYIYVTQKEWVWKTVSNGIPLTVGHSAPTSFECAYLLADLGGGGDGRVWLATTENGKVCILKFSSDKDMLEKEKTIWNTAWPSTHVRVCELNNQPVLVMPWVKLCTDEELTKPDVQEAVCRAVHRLSSVGYKHEDLDRRHIGLCKKDSKLEAILFDLARTSNVGPADSEQESAVSEMLEELHLTPLT